MLSNGSRTRAVTSTTARRTQSGLTRGMIGAACFFFFLRAAMSGSFRFGEARSSAFRLRRANCLHDLLHGIPIAICRGHAELLLELAEVTNGVHLPAIETEDESAFDGDDFCHPIGVGRKSQWETRLFAERLRQHI